MLPILKWKLHAFFSQQCGPDIPLLCFCCDVLCFVSAISLFILFITSLYGLRERSREGACDYDS